MSPYEAALQWIMSNPGSGSANSLAKLMLSLWNSRCAFAVSECVWNLDGARSELALRAIERYLKEGETPEFNRVCEQIHEAHPRLWELATPRRAQKPSCGKNGNWKIAAMKMRSKIDGNQSVSHGGV